MFQKSIYSSSSIHKFCKSQRDFSCDNLELGMLQSGEKTHNKILSNNGFSKLCLAEPWILVSQKIILINCLP